MKKMKKLVTLVVLLALLAIQLTSCAPATNPTASAADTEAAKVAGAKAEGQIVSYGMTDDWVNLGAIWKTIQTRYSVIHTDTDMTSAEQITRLLAEKAAP